jgi:hypothetical protein
LKHEWANDFHVSPFNSRKGTYSFAALNPYHKCLYRFPGIDNNVILASSNGHTKLVARLFSDDAPISPQDLGTIDCIAFIIQWCWQGLFTFPRILKETFLLFFRCHLHVWLRHEVRPTEFRAQSNNSREVSILFTIFSNTYLIL